MATINPLALIEKIIEEHGSSAIQGKHIALLREQVAILKEQLIERDKSTAELSSRASQLQAENCQLREKIRSLEAATQQKYAGDRPDEEHRLLIYLGTHDGVTAPIIAQHLGVSLERAKFNLKELDDADLTFGSHYYTGRQSEWHLTQEGRRYLVVRSLL